MSLWCPLTGPNMSRSGIRDHGEIDGRDRPAKAGIGHVAETAGPILEGRYILVEIHELAE